jgi:hypothetical protein
MGGELKRLCVLALLIAPLSMAQMLPMVGGQTSSSGGGSTVATPTVDTPAGTYPYGTQIGVFESTPGATTCVTYDGTTPTAPTPGTCGNGTPFAGHGLVVSQTVQAIGTKSGLTNSSVFSAAYVVTASIPSMIVPAGTYTSGMITGLNLSASGTNCFSIDGSTPTATTPGTCDGTTYSTPFSLSGNTTVKAIGTAVGLVNTAVQSFVYTISGASCTPASGYSHCRALTIDHTQVGGSTLSAFPVLVAATLGSSKIQNASCFDVVFSADLLGVNPIPWEQETCVQSTGVLVDWVRPYFVSASADTTIYVSYGNSGISTAQNSGGSAWKALVWVNLSGVGVYSAVYHLPDGTSLTTLDSTVSGRNGTNSGLTATAGQIDGGAATTGGSNEIALPSNALTFTNNFTVSGWANLTTQSSYQAIWSDAGTNRFLGSNPSGQAYAHTSAGGALVNGPTITAGWHYFVMTKSSSTGLILYYDGAATTNSGGTGASTSNSASDIGAAAGSFPWVGSLDEIRLVGVVMSAGWVTAEYNNQKASSTFLTVGSEI